MEKYYVVQEDESQPDITLTQHVVLKSKRNKFEHLTVAHNNKITNGTLVKVYETKNKEPIPLTMAYSYKLNGRRYVEMPRVPLTQFGIERFWDDLGYFDSVRLHNDIKQWLSQHKIAPALNKVTNMRLFLKESYIR